MGHRPQKLSPNLTRNLLIPSQGRAPWISPSCPEKKPGTSFSFNITAISSPLILKPTCHQDLVILPLKQLLKASASFYPRCRFPTWHLPGRTQVPPRLVSLHFCHDPIQPVLHNPARLSFPECQSHLSSAHLPSSGASHELRRWSKIYPQSLEDRVSADLLLSPPPMLQPQ